MRGARWLGLVAAVLVGVACFSADDFSDCVAPGQCGLGSDGRGRLCVDGACVAPPPVPDPGDAPVLAGPLADLHPYPEQTVIIDAVEVQQSLRVSAEVIIVQGPIDGAGRGLPGGDGGGGGRVGEDGDPGARGQPAREGAETGGPGGDEGGDGGDGQRGGGGNYPAAEPCRISFDFAQPGSGGGGGGGGSGVGAACRGSRGGVGGAGGAAIMLQATRLIEIRAPLIARGAPGDSPEDAVCDQTAVGGSGGGGSGGLVYLEAPTILFGEGAAIDVSGVDGGGPGLVTLYGTVEGRFPGVEGASGGRVCGL